jgi:hypothetical protein
LNALQLELLSKLMWRAMVGPMKVVLGVVEMSLCPRVF